jgi:hypothetical protein
MLQGWLACMCRFTYGLLTEDGLSNILFRNVCLVYMTSMSKVTLWLCVLGCASAVLSFNGAYAPRSPSWDTPHFWRAGTKTK